MPRSLPRALRAALLVLAVTAPAASAGTHVVSAYVWYHRYPKPLADKFTGGVAELVFRTDRGLAERSGFPQLHIGIGPQGANIATISRVEHCYMATVFFDPHGRIHAGSHSASALPGGRLRVRIGHAGHLLDRSFVVQSPRASFQRGRYLGCGADPASGTVYFGTEPSPEVAPPQIFFQADAGPYITGIRWSGWGTETAIGHGRFVSDCASCGAPEHKPATIVMHGLVPCLAFGAFIYRSGRFSRPYDGGRRVRPIPSGGFC